MNVYLVMVTIYYRVSETEENKVDAVFSTESLACEYAEKMNQHSRNEGNCNLYSVYSESFEVRDNI